jgi:hypothetical protein
MARPLTFEHWTDDGLHTYQYVAREGPVVEANWPGLFEGDWPEHGPTPYTEYAVNNNNCEEVAVYLGLIWRLTEGLLPCSVPRFHRDDATYAAGAPYALIDWEYEVENEAGRNLGLIRGFVPARSSVRMYPPPSPWEKENSGRAALYELPVFSMLSGVVRQTMADASMEVNIYALKQRSAERVAERLQAREPPLLVDLLEKEELFIDLAIGVDEGYVDVLVIHSPQDLSDLLDALVAEYKEAIDLYENDVNHIGSMDEFLGRIGELMNLGEEGELSRWGAGAS